MYDSLLELVAKFFGYTPRFLSENMDVVHPDSGMTAQEHFEDAESAGTWGWCDLAAERRGMYVWYDRDRGYEAILPALVATLAHEQGHLFGDYHPDALEEEKRAVGYELTAVSAHYLAHHIMRRECGTRRSLVDVRSAVLQMAQELQSEQDSTALDAKCADMIGALQELRGMVGVA